MPPFSRPPAARAAPPRDRRFNWTKFVDQNAATRELVDELRRAGPSAQDAAAMGAQAEPGAPQRVPGLLYLDVDASTALRPDQLSDAAGHGRRCRCLARPPCARS